MTATEILDTLYLGDAKDARSWLAAGEQSICVLDERGSAFLGELWVPVYDPKADRAIVKNLDMVGYVIGAFVEAGRKVLVRCGSGIERSPLAVAWYLMNWDEEYDTIADAYRFIMAKRPQVQDRSNWLPTEAPTGAQGVEQ